MNVSWNFLVQYKLGFMDRTTKMIEAKINENLLYYSWEKLTLFELCFNFGPNLRT